MTPSPVLLSQPGGSAAGTMAPPEAPGSGAEDFQTEYALVDRVDLSPRGVVADSGPAGWSAGSDTGVRGRDAGEERRLVARTAETVRDSAVAGEPAERGKVERVSSGAAFAERPPIGPSPAGQIASGGSWPEAARGVRVAGGPPRSPETTHLEVTTTIRDQSGARATEQAPIKPPGLSGLEQSFDAPVDSLPVARDLEARPPASKASESPPDMLGVPPEDAIPARLDGSLRGRPHLSYPIGPQNADTVAIPPPGRPLPDRPPVVAGSPANEPRDRPSDLAIPLAKPQHAGAIADLPAARDPVRPDIDRAPDRVLDVSAPAQRERPVVSKSVAVTRHSPDASRTPGAREAVLSGTPNASADKSRPANTAVIAIPERLDTSAISHGVLEIRALPATKDSRSGPAEISTSPVSGTDHAAEPQAGLSVRKAGGEPASIDERGLEAGTGRAGGGAAVPADSTAQPGVLIPKGGFDTQGPRADGRHPVRSTDTEPPRAVMPEARGAPVRPFGEGPVPVGPIQAPIETGVVRLSPTSPQTVDIGVTEPLLDKASPEPPKTPDSPRGAPAPIATVSDAAQKAVTSGSPGRVEVCLSPEELGTVRMTISHSGDVTQVVVAADRPETLDLVRRHADLLAQDLRAANGGSVDLSFSHNPQGSPRPMPGLPPDTKVPQDQSDPAMPPPALARPVVPATGIDLRL